VTDLAQYLIGGLVTGSIYGLVGVGFTAIYNATGIVIFAQGDFAALGAMSAIALHSAGVPLPLAIVLAIMAVAFVAMLVEHYAVRPIGHDVVRGIVVTIGVGVVLQGAMAVLWGTDAYALPAFSRREPIAIGGVSVPPQALWVIGTTGACMLLLNRLYRHTYVGKLFRACAVNPFAASLIGLRVGTISSWSFAIGGALGALAGIIVAPITLAQFDTGLSLGMKGFVACIIGGFGNPVGAVVGGFSLGIIEALIAGYLSSGYKNAIAFITLLAFLFLRPGGVLGELERARH
jgi:branched-chain amino acid transport system permease protein